MKIDSDNGVSRRVIEGGVRCCGVRGGCVDRREGS